MALVKALGTLTSDGTVPTANDTVTIGGRVYTWKAAPTTVADEVKIGATVAISMANLAAAINLSAGAGSLYGSLTTQNVLVTAVAGATTVVITARAPGTAGNQITTVEGGTHTSFGAATLASGAGDLYTSALDLYNSAQMNAQVETWFLANLL